MAEVKLIVPFHPDELVKPKHLNGLINVGAGLDWIVHWCFHNWDVLGDWGNPYLGNELQAHDRLYSDLEQQIASEFSDREDEEADRNYTLAHAMLEEYSDECIRAAHDVYTSLEPYIGDMTWHHPTQHVMGVDYEAFSDRDMVITVMLEER